MADSRSARKPWLKFYPADWRSDPKLRMCSIAARGLWMEMICLMHEADPGGSLLVSGKAITNKQLSSLVGSTAKDVEALVRELEDAGVFSRDPDQTIFSRRMRRDIAKADRDRANGKGGGNPQLVGSDNGGVNPPVNPKHGNWGSGDNPNPNGEDKAQRPEARGQKEKPAPTESVTATAAAERAGAAKRFEFSLDDNSEDSYRNAEHACIVALGGTPAQGGIAPTDPVFHPIMSLINQGISLDSIAMVLREMAKKPPHEPIRTWKLFASKVAKKLESLPKITPAAATVDIRGIKVPEQRVVEYIKKYQETGKWPENWGLPPDHPNTSIPARLREPQVAN